MIVVTAFLLRQGRPVASMLPTMTLFAMASVKIMPVFQRLMNALNMIKDAIPSVNVIFRDLKNLEPQFCLPAVVRRRVLLGRYSVDWFTALLIITTAALLVAHGVAFPSKLKGRPPGDQNDPVERSHKTQKTDSY